MAELTLSEETAGPATDDVEEAQRIFGNSTDLDAISDARAIFVVLITRERKEGYHSDIGGGHPESPGQLHRSESGNHEEEKQPDEVTELQESTLVKKLCRPRTGSPLLVDADHERDRVSLSGSVPLVEEFVAMQEESPSCKVHVTESTAVIPLKDAGPLGCGG